MANQIFKEKLSSKLEEMKGKLYLFRTENYRLINYKINEETVDIVTNHRWFSIPLDDKAWRFISEFLEVEEENPEVELSLFTPQSTNQLRNVMLDSIEQLKTNPGYVKQANAINQTINTMINCAKMEFSMKKLKGN